MQRSDFRRGLGTFLLAAILGFPGLSASDFFLDFRSGWDLLVGVFLEDEAPPLGDPGTGGGAMDPNGGKPKPRPTPGPGPHP